MSRENLLVHGGENWLEKSIYENRILYFIAEKKRKEKKTQKKKKKNPIFWQERKGST